MLSAKNPYDILFFDIDGTLIDHKTCGCIPLSAVACLKVLQRRGVKLFIATGRAPVMLDHIYPIYPFDGYVTTNGQYVHERDGRVLRRHAFAPEAVLALAEAAKREDFPCLILEEQESFSLFESAEIRGHYNAMDIPAPPVYDFARLDTYPVIQCLAYITPQREHCLASIPGITAIDTGGHSYDVLPAGGGKDVGAAAAAAAYGIPRERTMGFGDGDNDAALLRWTGVGVAMGDGSPRCLSAADYVTAPAGEDGVFKALLHFGAVTEVEVTDELARLRAEGPEDRFREDFPGKRPTPPKPQEK